MKQIIGLVLKWKINAEQNKEMMPTRSKKVLGFSVKNLNLLDVELLQESEKCIVKMVQLKYLNKERKLLKMETKKMLKLAEKSAA